MKSSRLTRCMQIFMLVVTPSLATSANALILVEFESTINFFNPGPLPRSEVFNGSFEIDDTVIPTASGNKYFNGAIDNFQFSIDGQSFGGTDGRLLQFTNASGTGGFMGGTLNNTHGSVFGVYNDGARNWRFDGMGFDWRGLSADLFPSSDPALISDDLVRNATQNDFGYALMSLHWTPLDTLANTLSDDSLRVSFNTIQFSRVNGSIPEPVTLLLMATGLLGLRVVRHRSE